VLDQLAALRGIARVTLPGGRVIVQQVCDGPRPSIEDVAMRICESPRWAPYFTGFAAPYVHVDPDRYSEMAVSAGLEVRELGVRDLTWDFRSQADFAAWLTVGCVDWTSRLPSDDVPDFISDVLAAYEPIAGAPARFRFLQLRCEMTPAG
jgi:trans-aconitate 2-methyltransferase